MKAYSFHVITKEYGRSSTDYLFRTREDAVSFITDTLGSLVSLFESVTLVEYFA